MTQGFDYRNWEMTNSVEGPANAGGHKIYSGIILRSYVHLNRIFQGS